MSERIMEIVKWMMSHRNLYFALGGCHLWAAVATGKPEVYLPMMVIYFVLGWG